MESQAMQASFLNHIISFFAPPRDRDEVTGVVPDERDERGATAAAGALAAGCPDLPVLLGLLRGTGFRVKYSDKGERGGASDGCRAIIICKRSGTRVVLDGEGPCTCPPEEILNKYLHPGQAPSRAPSPTPSTAGQLEDALNTSMMSTASSAAPVGEAPAPLSRQRTWSRDANAPDLDTAASTASPASRRLSAPPGSVHSPWTTLHGDDLNVLAAADLLQEAMSLLSGVKKVNLRNTPIGPARRLSAAASRRLSSDTFAQPLRPLSRTSSTSSGTSGLGSLRSTASATSTASSHADTPRPPRPGAALRRTISAAGTTGSTVAAKDAAGVAAKAKASTTSVLSRTKSDANKKGPADMSSVARSQSTKMPSLLKPPSSVSAKSSSRTPSRVGIKTNATLLMGKSDPSKTISKSPDMESIKL